VVTHALSRDVNRTTSRPSTQRRPTRARRWPSGRVRRLRCSWASSRLFEAASAAAGRDVRAWLVLLPAVRHADKHHAFDGGTQRPQCPKIPRMSSMRSTSPTRCPPARSGLAAVAVTRGVGEEALGTVFERLPGKRKRAPALLSLVL